MIARAHQTVLETQDVGNEITEELKRNKEKILSSREKVSLRNYYILILNYF